MKKYDQIIFKTLKTPTKSKKLKLNMYRKIASSIQSSKIYPENVA